MTGARTCVGRIVAACVLAGLSACAARDRDTPPPPTTPPARTTPAPPVSVPAPVSIPAPVSVPAPPEVPLTGAIDCPVKREWTVRLLADRGPFRAQWRECPASGRRLEMDVPEQQIALWLPGNPALAWGLHNLDEENFFRIESTREMDLDGDGLEEMLILMRHPGSGGFIEWCLLGRKDTGIGCWDPPDLEEPAARLLAEDEDFGFRGWAVRPEARALRLERSVFHKGVDANCCPTRGLVVARLVPRGGRLGLAAIVRRSRGR